LSHWGDPFTAHAMSGALRPWPEPLLAILPQRLCDASSGGPARRGDRCQGRERASTMLVREKILADKKQGKRAFFNPDIGRALAEIAICKVNAFAPALIGVRGALSERFCYRSLVLVDFSVESAFYSHTGRPRPPPNDVVGARAISSVSPAAASGWPQPDLSQSPPMGLVPTPSPRGAVSQADLYRGPGAPTRRTAFSRGTPPGVRCRVGCRGFSATAPSLDARDLILRWRQAAQAQLAAMSPESRSVRSSVVGAFWRPCAVVGVR